MRICGFTLSLAILGLLALSPVVEAADADAALKLPSIFGSGMVLQRGQENPVWGWSEANDTITLKIAGKTLTAKSDAEGMWMTKLPAMDATDEPLTLTVSCQHGKQEFTDILVGEVWICSGQSNMEWPMTQINDSKEEIASAKFPKIRLFKAQRTTAAEPQPDVKGSWQVCSPQTVPGFSAVGYFFGRTLHQELEVPVGLVESAWGGTLAEAWTSDEALKANENFSEILKRGANYKAGQPNQASNLYDGMLHPLIPYGIRGAIWYQGESNVGRAAQYAELFPAMIRDWRQQWGQGDFPFLFVQLAPYHYGNNGLLPEQWASQLHTLKTVKNTGMAVTTDIGNTKDIHPRNKQDVGKRLALWALANTYGQSNLVYSGPIYNKVEFKDGKAFVSFEHIGGGLMAKGGDLTDFTIAAADGEFVPAKAKIEGDQVVVWSDEVEEPAAVRFGWSNTAEPNLFNKAGLPASPFRTDDRPLKTANNR